MLGTEIAEQCKARGWECECPTIEDVNIGYVRDVKKWFGEYRNKCLSIPDAVINCAAWSSVDGCENLPGDAFVANCIGPKNLADACIAYRVGMFVQVSTDYVFAGANPFGRFSPSDNDFFPSNTYGITKAAGELAVRSAYHRALREWAMGERTLAGIPDYIIVRTSRLYGKGRRNYVDFVCDLCLSDMNGIEPPTSPQPIEHTNITIPTAAKDVAKIILSAIDGNRDGLCYINAVDGLGTDNSAPSLYEYTEAIYQILKDLGKNPYRWFTKAEKPEPKAGSANRPFNSTLEPPQMLAPYEKIPYWKDSLREYIKERVS